MQNEADYAEKKVKILIFDYFLDFECLNLLDTAYQTVLMVLHHLATSNCQVVSLNSLVRYLLPEASCSSQRQLRLGLGFMVRP